MKPIAFARPVLGKPEERAAARAIRSGWVTQGPEVNAFELEFAAAVGAKHAVAVSSATTALHLALKAAGVGPGDEVVTASHSFVATANAVRYCGAVPVFADIDPATLNVDPACVEKLLSRRTRAILCVHQIGMPCDLDALAKLARRRKLVLIEDAACAAGSEVRWRGRWQRVGRPHGDVACFSFHPRKVLTTGDGGMLTTSRADWAAKFRLWRQHGMSVSDAARHGAKKVVFESYETLGYNYRMTDIQAAIGRVQMGRLEGILVERRRLAARYNTLLDGDERIGLPFEPAGYRHTYQSYCIRLRGSRSRPEIMAELAAAGIASRRGVMAIHLEPYYRARFPAVSLPATEAAASETLLLPLFAGMTGDEQDTVVSRLKAALG